jgi:hypothetical protein
MSFARLFAIVLVACACFSGAAKGSPTVNLRVSLHPNRLGQRTTIGLTVHIDSPPGALSSPARSLVLRLPANMGLAASTLGQANCEAAALIALGVNGCSANARIGFGSASAAVPVGSENLHERASLTALLGPPAEDRLEVLWYIQAAEPVFAQLVLPSVVEEAEPPFGEELATSVPLTEAWPEGPDLALETFDTSIGPMGLTYHRQVAGKTVAFHPQGIRIPRICPPGGYGFAALLNFQNGTRSTSTYHVPCPRR